MLTFDTDIGVIGALMQQDPVTVARGLSLVPGFATAPFDTQLEGLKQLGQQRVGQMDLRTQSLLSPIPLYHFSNVGERKVEAWPCVSFELVTILYDKSARRVHPRDQIVKPVEGTYQTVTSAFGTQLSGYAQVTTRPHPEPYIMRYDIGVWSRDSTEANLIVATVLERMPPNNGALPTVFADGTTYNLQLDLETIVNTDGEIPELSSPETGRGWHYTLTYRVETWMDMTLATKIARTISSAVELNSTRLPNT